MREWAVTAAVVFTFCVWCGVGKARAADEVSPQNVDNSTDVTARYIDAVVPVKTLNLAPKDKLPDESFLRQIIATTLDQYAADNIEVTFDAPLNGADKIQESVAAVSFTSPTPQQALQAVAALGQAREGVKWQTFSLTSPQGGPDARGPVVLSGKLAFLLMDVVE